MNSVMKTTWNTVDHHVRPVNLPVLRQPSPFYPNGSVSDSLCSKSYNSDTQLATVELINGPTKRPSCIVLDRSSGEWKRNSFSRRQQIWPLCKVAAGGQQWIDGSWLRKWGVLKETDIILILPPALGINMLREDAVVLHIGHGVNLRPLCLP